MEEILTYTVAAEKENIAEIIKQNSSGLKRFIRNAVRSVQDAEDILQDVFVQLSLADSLAQPIEQISSWLFTVAKNKIIDFRRKKKTVSMPEVSNDSDEESLMELREFIFDESNNPEFDFLRSAVWNEINKALDELPQEQKVVFELNEIKGIPFKEISLLTGEAVNTLISRKRYAVLYLRKKLQSLYDEFINF